MMTWMGDRYVSAVMACSMALKPRDGSAEHRADTVRRWTALALYSQIKAEPYSAQAGAVYESRGGRPGLPPHSSGAV